MNSPVELIRDLYGVNTSLFMSTLEDVKETDIFIRPQDKANSLHWVAGHMTTSRYIAANILGIDDGPPWGKMFDRGAEVKDKSVYPSIAEIKTAWQDISGKIMERFDVVTDEDLAGDPPFEVPGMECTKAATLAFLHFHESYHLGQLNYTRRLCDYDRLFG
jgi:uncharacterized damage-inducible protein DinB